MYQAASARIERCEVSQTGDTGISVADQSSPTVVECWVHDTQGVGVMVGRGCNGLIEGTTCGEHRAPGCFDRRWGQSGGAGRRRGRRCSPAAGVSSGDNQQDPKLVEKLLAELDGMIGLETVKHEVRALIDEIQVNEWRRSEGLSVGMVSHHLVFTGAARHRQDHCGPDLRPVAQGARHPASRLVQGGRQAGPGRPVHWPHRGEDRLGLRGGVGGCPLHRRGVHPLAAGGRQPPTSVRRRSTPSSSSWKITGTRSASSSPATRARCGSFWRPTRAWLRGSPRRWSSRATARAAGGDQPSHRHAGRLRARQQPRRARCWSGSAGGPGRTFGNAREARKSAGADAQGAVQPAAWARPPTHPRRPAAADPRRPARGGPRRG